MVGFVKVGVEITEKDVFARTCAAVARRRSKLEKKRELVSLFRELAGGL